MSKDTLSLVTYPLKQGLVDITVSAMSRLGLTQGEACSEGWNCFPADFLARRELVYGCCCINLNVINPFMEKQKLLHLSSC